MVRCALINIWRTCLYLYFLYCIFIFLYLYLICTAHIAGKTALLDIVCLLACLTGIGLAAEKDHQTSVAALPIFGAHFLSSQEVFVSLLFEHFLIIIYTIGILYYFILFYFYSRGSISETVSVTLLELQTWLYTFYPPHTLLRRDVGFGLVWLYLEKKQIIGCESW